MAQLVPFDIHDASKHTGGTADIKALQKSAGASAAAAVGSLLIPHSMEAAEKGGNPVAAALKDVGAIADPGVEPFFEAERYARDHDLMGSFENLLMYGTFTAPKPLNINR